jgi:hypothetical protein
MRKNAILGEKIITLRKEGKSYCEISETLNCSKSVVSYHCRKNGISPVPLEDPDKNLLLELITKNLSLLEIGEIIHRKGTATKRWLKKYDIKYSFSENREHCVVCNKDLSKQQRKYCSVSCKMKGLRISQLAEYGFGYQEKLGFLRKVYFIEQLGGKCSICGYDKNISALEFHHLKDKEMSLTQMNLRENNIELILKELDKCILLCSNCHKELHYPQANIDRVREGKLGEYYNKIFKKPILRNK